MAKKKNTESKIETEHLDVEFSERDKFCETAFEEAWDRHEEIRDIDIENQEFYEGRDTLLDERKSNKRVARSSIFVNEAKPAVDTRIANALARTEQGKSTITGRPFIKNASEEDRLQAMGIAEDLTTELREIGYLTDIFREHIAAAEMYRSPSAVKVTWEPNFEMEAVKVPRGPLNAFIDNIAAAFRSGGALPQQEDRVEFRRRINGGKPVVTWLPPGQFLYQPNVSRFHEDSIYVIQAEFLPFHIIMKKAVENSWDVAKLEQFKQENDSDMDSDAPVNRDSIDEEIKDNQGIAYKEATKNGDMLLTETIVVEYDADTGEKSYHTVVRVGNKHTISDEPLEPKAIGFPYSIIAANRTPGTLESLSTIDAIKPAQRVLNEAYNSWLDWMTYGLFMPMKGPKNMTFKGTPRWEPGALWLMSNPDELKPVLPTLSTAPNLPQLILSLASVIRNTIPGASDLEQALDTGQHEKATKVAVRAQATLTKSVPTFKDYGKSIMEVANIVLRMKQQFDKNPARWVVNGGVVLDVPALTGVTDQNQEKQDLLTIYQGALESPLYLDPETKVHLRRMWHDFVAMVKPHDVDRYVPSEEDVIEFVRKQSQQQQLIAEKASINENMQMELQAQAQQQAQGESNVETTNI